MKHFLKSIMPNQLVYLINKMRNELRWKYQLYCILSFYKKKINLTNEEAEVINFLRSTNHLAVFPYANFYSIDINKIQVFEDTSCNLKYVMHNGLKIYFKKSFNRETVIGVYYGLINEQKNNSPHQYLSDSFNMLPDTILVDIGAAEGIFTLNNINKIKHAYLFEPDTEWIEPLYHTFLPWKDKITIINKYVSDFTNENMISLDDYQFEYLPNFIKADVEGYELSVLIGATKLLSKVPDVKIAVCTYHKQEDFDQIQYYLKSKRPFLFSHSYGYMLFYITNNLKKPYLRRGILRAELS